MHVLPYELCKPIYDRLDLSFWPEQEAILKDETRFPIIVGGERAGKTHTGSAKMVPHVHLLPFVKPEKFYWMEDGPGHRKGELKFNPRIHRPRSPHFTLFGPNYKEPQVEFEAIENHLRNLGDLVETGINQPSKGKGQPWTMVTKSGVVVTTWSMEDPRNIRAVDLEGAMLCETGNMPEDGALRVHGRVSGTEGFIIYSGTLEEAQKWYRDLCLLGQRPNDLFHRTFRLPSWTNRKVFPGGIDNPEIQLLKRKYSPDLFDMRVAALPRPPRDRVLDTFTEDIVRDDIEIPDDAEIQIYQDPGYASAYALLWVATWYPPVEQDEYDENGRLIREAPEPLFRRFFYVFDEFYEQGKNARAMVAMAKAHPMWPRLMKTRKCVIDIASKGHRDSTDSALEVWQQLTTLDFNMKYWDGGALKERLRTSAHTKQIAIHPKCKGLLAEAGLEQGVFEGMHHWKYPTDREGKVTGEVDIDKWNHSAKALGYGLLDNIGPVEHMGETVSFNRLKTKQSQHTTYFRQRFGRTSRR